MNSNAPIPKTVDEYLAGQPATIRPRLDTLRKTLQAAAPDATEAIKYMMPTFVYHGNLVHFAACKDHLGFYPTPSAIRQFAEELSSYVTSKGAIQFPWDRPLPLPLITQIVRFRVAESRTAAERKGSAGRRAAPKKASGKR
ncbi:MAG: DUF1801 domain-containing protein [Verrucomicrobiae bacterium]|nr:DUF1801 domain-containing protein [Verrucomicrobiae bacterium]